MENQLRDRHVILIEELESKMKQRSNEKPRLLNNSAGRSSCCIFRVPQSIVETNNKAYQPHIVSIGPYHHGKDHLKMIQEHKWRFLRDLLNRTQSTGMRLDDCLKGIASLEGRIRDCYSESINFSARDLTEMMVLDGFFIIELFSKVGDVVPIDADDPIFGMAWVFPFLIRDLLRLENQIPYFVLQNLFQKSRTSREENGPSLATLALGFFNYAARRPVELLRNYRDLEGKHLLDLFHKSLIPRSPELKVPVLRTNLIAKREGKKIIPLIQLTPSAKNLNIAGIKIKMREADSFLDIKFRNGVLEIPEITIDDFAVSLFMNCVAFEQCYSHCSKHITAYATFMGCLVNTAADAGFVCDCKIIENFFGTHEEVAHFFNNLAKDVAFDIEQSYLSKLFEDVNRYYRNNWHVQWAGFKHTYFDTPWSFMSALAAVILLLLTITQTFFAVYGYFRPPGGADSAPPPQ